MEKRKKKYRILSVPHRYRVINAIGRGILINVRQPSGASSIISSLSPSLSFLFNILVDCDFNAL